jgi:threonine/homoserine/homoserine lactone efflux protein
LQSPNFETVFIIPLFAGFIISFIASLPTGPVNMAIVHGTLLYGKKSGLLIAAGAMLVEVFYCTLSIFGMNIIFGYETFLRQLSLISIPILLGMGLVSMFKKDFLKRDYKPKSGNEFITGTTLTLANPMILFFWITVTAFLQSNEWMQDRFIDQAMFVTGVAAGLFLLFYTLIRITYRQNKKVTPRFKRNMNVILGWVFIGLALIMTLKAGYTFILS